MAQGETALVHDLAGVTLDTTVLRADPDGFMVLGQPEGLDNLGGTEFDEAVFTHSPQPEAGAYKLAGDPGNALWRAIKLCRFAPGELDDYVPEIRRLPADAPIPPR